MIPFQQRDNMLRESSIAHDYWQCIIENIMKEEQEKFSRERRARFKRERESVETNERQQKLINLLDKTINKINDSSSMNNNNSTNRLQYHSDFIVSKRH